MRLLYYMKQMGIRQNEQVKKMPAPAFGLVGAGGLFGYETLAETAGWGYDGVLSGLGVGDWAETRKSWGINVSGREFGKTI